MNETELRAILHSDMKLWDAAVTTTDGPTTVTKVLELPYGIGRTEVTLEGLDDAGKRREAVTGFGAYIRRLIIDRVDDDSISARAKQKAAFASEDANKLSGDGRDDNAGPDREVGGVSAKVSDTETVATPNVTVLSPEDMAGRRRQIENSIQRLEENLAALRGELVGITAYLEAMNYGPQNEKTPQPSKGAASRRKS